MVARDDLRWNGWGPVEQADPFAGHPRLLDFLAGEIGVAPGVPRQAAPISAARLSAPLDDLALRRFRSVLGDDAITVDGQERARRAGGKSYPDLIRLRTGDASAAPAAVLLPRSAEDIVAAFGLIAEMGLSAVPFGGGTSVVGGVNGTPQPWVAIDTARLDRIEAIDEHSMTATIGCGMYGPALEAALAARGFTLGHFPQSFLYSTLGGWIAANGAGQQSGRYGRPPDWLLGAEMATPSGTWRGGGLRRSSAGPWLTGLMIGSEGLLGVLTKATVRIRREPEARDYRGYVFPDFLIASEALRACAQDDIGAAMLRLSDAEETRIFGTVSRLRHPPSKMRSIADLYLKARGAGPSPSFLIAGFEGGRERVRQARRAAERHFSARGAIAVGPSPGRSWWRGRFDSPAMRDPLLARGIGLDTIETATTWSNLGNLYRAVTGALETAFRGASEPGAGRVMAHISHCYPEAASLYFTFLFPQQAGRELDQWAAVKRAATQAIVENGGTISHHHGVGTDHLEWMHAEKGSFEVELLQSVKRQIDPDGLLNPGKLLP